MRDTLVRHIPVARAAAAATAFACLALASSCRERPEQHAVMIAPERSCTGTLTLAATDIKGESLPPKTLALTFDDGPGKRTLELSAFLKARGIASTFFVNGKNLVADSPVLAQLVADGHLVANHTQTHTSLTGRATGGLPLSAAAVVDEVAQTDALIAPFTSATFLFRAPYGDFDAQTAAFLDASAMSKYVGPINWDIGDHMGVDQAADWDCWQLGSDMLVLTPQQCGERYVSEIERVGRGIVLLHDPYFIDGDPQKGGTVDMIQSIVPILQARGYAFVRVDRVPEIAAQLPAAPAPSPSPTPAPAPEEDAAADAAGASGPSAAPPATASPEPARKSGLDDNARTPDPCAR